MKGINGRKYPRDGGGKWLAMGWGDTPVVLCVVRLLGLFRPLGIRQRLEMV